MPEKRPGPLLVVEDDKSVRPLYVKILEREGYEVLSATNSEDALRLIQTRKPTLAIVDIHIPGKLKGFDLCRKLREDGLSSTEVLLITGVFIQESNKREAYEAGALGFLKKPLDNEKFVGEVRSLLEEPEPFLQLSRGKSREEGVLVADPPALGKVLVVDDDEEMLGSIAVNLEGERFLPYAARSGYKAIALAHRIRPQAVILDLRLPDIDGLTVMRILRADPRTAGIAILVWTGSAKKGMELSCLQDGADEYLVKGVHAVSAIPLRLKKMLHLEGPKAGIIEEGPVRMDRSSRKVWVLGAPLQGLTFKEFELLAYLLERSPAIAAWDDIERDIWKLPPEKLTHSYATPTIDVHRHRLMNKLEPKVAPCLVVHKGFGLQFDPIRIAG